MLHDSFAEAARLGGRSRKPGAQRLGYSLPPRLGNFTADSESLRAYIDLLELTNFHKNWPEVRKHFTNRAISTLYAQVLTSFSVTSKSFG